MTLVDQIRRLEALDVDLASSNEVRGALDDLRRIRGWASKAEAQLTRRAEHLAASHGAVDPTDLLSRSSKGSRRDADKRRRRAETLDSAPSLESELGRGRISDEHVDAMTNAAGRVDDEAQRAELFASEHELAQRAVASTPGQFARHLGRVIDRLGADAGLERSERQRTLASLSHGIDESTGMGFIRADLHPDDYQKVKGRLEAEIVARAKRGDTRDRRRIGADALVDLVCGARAVSTPPPEVSIHIDHRTLVDGLHDQSLCEYVDGTPLPVDTVRRHACTAHLIPIVLDGAGQPLDVGRASRLATPAQRRALRSMYRTCAIDGCECSFDRCEIHHLDDWTERNGPTDLDNLIPLCSYHHHRCHEGRWRLSLEPVDRRLTVTLPDGTHHSSALPDFLAEREARRRTEPPSAA
ncbi:MAG: DUF222 domain-containing protein [Actinomycetota bacterium]